MLYGSIDRRAFIGGSDARVIMGDDEADLVRLWREKRGEVEPEDLSDNLIVQLGTVTEDLNRRWYERNTGTSSKTSSGGSSIRSSAGWQRRWTVWSKQTGAVFEAKFMLPWSFSEEAAAEKHMAQLQHNMWVADARSAVLSIITGGGKWVEIDRPRRPAVPAPADHRGEEVLALRQDGETPRLFGIEPPRPRLEAVRMRRYERFE